MTTVQTIWVACRALLRNKMRSFLTTLGIVIGVAAVISMSAIGAGARARVSSMFESMGANILIVFSGSSRQGGMRGGQGSQPTLTWADLDRIREDIPDVRYAAPMMGIGAQVMAEGQNWQTQVRGTTADYFGIRNWPAASGEIFGDVDEDAGAKVAVVGQTVVNNLFGEDYNPVGQLIRINNIPFSIIGVAAKKGNNAWGSDEDDVVFVPSSTFRAKLQGGLQQFIPGTIMVGAVSQEATGSAKTAIEKLLRERHRIRPGNEDDFTVRNMSEMASAQQEGARTMTSLLAGIALVSLIVGGIGIMNIMLVSVTERTREIGLRMALGAKPAAILIQFVTEAVVLSVIGGLLGVAAGIGAARYLVTTFDWPLLIEPMFSVIAVGFSGIVGVVFGLYPAWKASRLDPIQALRFE
ncbi:MAG TPA: ABC transporter permease [Myxococcota bacterium]|nr:ABC transporter permease [Myxococcota bacterium]HOA13417.1 ABC transporter permease [Myxococcota bacterium]HOH76628.1 ABC transporter permease [Myxococcota bacterium]HPV03673.1 ABC transporter permease [Myxococcota bacterium]